MADKKFNLMMQLRANSTEFTRGMRRAQSSLGSFQNVANSFSGNVATSIAAAFGTAAILNFSKEAVVAAAESEGIVDAFNKLDDVDLASLRSATKDTVSDLNLMKAAVKAAEFGIDSSKMPQLMQFAAIQAGKLGESVDYMVDSIVTGLSRGSVQILDNLGLSAGQLREEMKKTGDITSAAMNVIEDKLATGGGIIDNNATKLAQMRAEWENIRIEIGNELMPVFVELADRIKEHIPGWVDGAKNTAKFIAENIDVILRVAKQTGRLIVVVYGLRKAIAAVQAVMNANLYVLVTTAAINLGLALDGLIEKSEKFRKEQENFFGDSTLRKGELIKKNARDLTDLYKEQKSELAKVNDALKKGGSFMRPELEASLKREKAMYESNLALIRQVASEKIKALKEGDEPTISAARTIATIQAEIKEQQELQKSATAAELPLINTKLSSLQQELKYMKELSAVKGGEFEVDLTEIDNSYKEAKAKIKAEKDKLDEMFEFGFDIVEPEIFDSSDNLDNMLDKLKSAKEEMGEISTASQTIAGGITGIGEAFGQMASDSEGAWKNLVGSMMSGISQIINGLLAKAIAGMIAGEATKGLPGLITAGIGVGALTALWQSQVPAFETGGIVPGNSFTGDKVLTRLNSREMVLNTDQQRNLFNMVDRGGISGGSGGIQTFELKLRGRDAVAMINTEMLANKKFGG